jgi:uncharacterized repeat protein (TIGR03803 family)
MITASASAATLTTLASFDFINNGGFPSAGLVADDVGNLYGTTASGGDFGAGTIYRLEAATNALTTPASFDGGTTGSEPRSTLIFDGAGNLYGTSISGYQAYGSVVRWEAATGMLTQLAGLESFPRSGLIADAAGNLYGTTSGTPTSFGTVFRVDPANGAVSYLVNFEFDDMNGIYPVAGLLADSAGNLYGTTLGGGAFPGPCCDNLGLGTVFRVDAVTNALTTLASFDGSNGRQPRANLVADAAGNLYGTTSQGGAFDLGTVFRLELATGTITTLATFDGDNGAGPVAGLIADALGNLFGTTEQGGDSGAGTVFRLDAGTNTLTTLVSFDGDNGGEPEAGLIADANGNLYGTTQVGGEFFSGTIFRLSNAGFVVIPEPSALLLAALGVGAAISARRRVS